MRVQGPVHAVTAQIKGCSRGDAAFWRNEPKVLAR